LSPQGVRNSEVPEKYNVSMMYLHVSMIFNDSGIILDISYISYIGYISIRKTLKAMTQVPPNSAAGVFPI
jgi:hypothetical protein